MFKPQTNRSNTQTVGEVQRVVDHLGHAFSIATKDMPRAARVGVEGSNGPVPNELYQLQVTFSYMIDDIVRGPRYIAPKIIADCNEFIAKIGNK